MIIGRLTKDPEIRTTPQGKKVARISVAITMSKNKETGESKVEYIDASAWHGLAEILEKYATKGTLLYLEGSITTTNWDGSDGKKNYKTEILIKELKLLSQPKKNNSDPSVSPQVDPTPTSAGGITSGQADEMELPDIDEIVTPW